MRPYARNLQYSSTTNQELYFEARFARVHCDILQDPLPQITFPLSSTLAVVSELR